jgi:tRNA U34 2-thiouridine synthase MnmA/TrmU
MSSPIGERDHPALYATSLRCADFTWISGRFPAPDESMDSFRALVQFRHRMEPAPCRVSRRGEQNAVVLDFDAPQYAVAPGQIAAVYVGEQCMGCGVIEAAGLQTEDS